MNIILNNYLKVKEYINRYIVKMPVVYWIETINLCNLSCVMCPESKGLQRPKCSMGLEQFKTIIDQISENNPLIKLYLIGEPLLSKDIFKMIDYANKKDCFTMIHTNATLLNEEMSTRLLESPLTYLSFSFDGATPEIYEKLRPPAKFEEVKNNIEKFLQLHKAYEKEEPFTTIEIINMKDTKESISSFVSYWKTKGCNVNVQPVMDWCGLVENLGIETKKNFGYKPCIMPFKVSCILSDGTIVPCCLDANGKLPLGNIFKESFKKIWYGKLYNELRIQQLRNEINNGSICKGCMNTFCRSRRDFFEIYFYAKLGLKKKALNVIERIGNNKMHD